MEPTLTDKDIMLIKDRAIEYWHKQKYDPYAKDDRMEMTLCYIKAMTEILRERHFININIEGE